MQAIYIYLKAHSGYRPTVSAPEFPWPWSQPSYSLYVTAIPISPLLRPRWFYLDGFLRLLLFVKLHEGKALGVLGGLVPRDADVHHLSAFGEHLLDPVVSHALRQKFLEEKRKKET